MFATYRAQIRKGRISLMEKTRIPDGAKVLVTVIPEDESAFWAAASETSLKQVWNNTEDDVYEKLLRK